MSVTRANPTEPGVSVVHLAAVEKTYPHPVRPVRALRGVNLDIAPGEFVAIMGASGSGKSTLLHIIGGLDRPDAGRVLVAGRDLTTMNDRHLTLFRRRQVGVVFQFFNLVGTLTALENVALPMAIDWSGKDQTCQRASALLSLVNLTERADHRPDALSGGEQQRVAIARALLMDPPVILADEPTGNLDSLSSQAIWELLGSLAHQLGKTICVATHESSVAAQANRILVMKDGQFVGSIDAAAINHDPSLVATRYQELAG